MLDHATLRTFCLNMTGAVEEFPFGPDAAVFKVMGKMFALMPVVADPPTISLKCDPIEAVILRQQYPSVQPGYLLNKKHWNTVVSDGSHKDERLKEMVEDSYVLVRQKLTRKARAELDELENDE